MITRDRMVKMYTMEGEFRAIILFPFMVKYAPPLPVFFFFIIILYRGFSSVHDDN